MSGRVLLEEFPAADAAGETEGVKRMWTKEAEKEFFSWAFSEHKAKPDQLFYRVGDRYFFYLPKGWFKIC